MGGFIPTDLGKIRGQRQGRLSSLSMKTMSSSPPRALSDAENLEPFFIPLQYQVEHNEKVANTHLTQPISFNHL